ncbi:MAG TPA: biotin/lipoyl-containing protein [Pseudonocardiaceae bacterium]|nr:biotin/lipoyl-containing protein [Pseudonocardiaceae bacterium]
MTEHDGEALEQVRHHTQRLLADIPAQPSALHVRNGDAAVDLEWPTDGGEARSAEPAEPAQPAAPQSKAEPDTTTYLTAPTVGVFYRAPEPGATPFVAEDDVVSVGQQVGIVEVMKLMVPVEAEAQGRIAKVLKDDGAQVEYGDQLFALAPADAA